MNTKIRWLAVVLFATAMAWVEAAVVFYLRTMIDRIEPYQPTPLPIFGGLGKAELVREFSTLVMLSTVGFLAGNNRRSRFGYFLIAFGIWDIFYYVFLKILTGWPHSLADWDILFLLPLPWWGPVWAPVSIALVMILWGTLASQHESYSSHTVSGWNWGLMAALGALIALYVFMSDAFHTSRAGGSLRKMLPDSFDWKLFSVGLLLMTLPSLSQIFHLATRHSAVRKNILNT